MQQYKYIKGSAEDFVGAPSWASSRAMIRGLSAFVNSTDSRYIYIDVPQLGKEFTGKFIAFPWAVGHVELMAQREPIPEWNGDGLPPVGLMVELMDDSQSQAWGEVTIKFLGKSFAVWDDHGEECSNSLCHVHVRPILTEAERKREEAVNAISEICRSSASNGHSGELIYDAIAAGKIPGINLD